MFNLLLAVNLWSVDLWYALPVIIVVSLVYSATHHEEMGAILMHAGRLALWIVGFMFIAFLVLALVSWQT